MRPPSVHPLLWEALQGGGPEAPAEGRAAGDWEAVIQDAAAHGLIPILHRWLQRTGTLRALPAALHARLERDAVGVAARNLLLARELGTILRACAARDLACAPLRGLALAERLYGDITARPTGDLDLLVRRDDLPRVAEILRGLGFQEMDRRPGFADRYWYTREFFKDLHGWIVVEPHWTIAYPPFADRVDMDRVWRRCERGVVAGADTWMLAPEDVLLNLALHLIHRDATAPLLWRYEMDRLIRRDRESLDWSCVLATARAAGVERLLGRALTGVRTLFETPLPDPVLDLATGGSARSLDRRLARLVGEGSDIDGAESLAHFFAVPGWGSRLRYALALLFPAPRFMRMEYAAASGHRLAIAYVRRVCHLSWEGAKGIVRLLNLPTLP